MNQQRRTFLGFILVSAAALLQTSPIRASDSRRSERFSADERKIIEDYYRKGKPSKKKGLPPGLAKRGGNLPPGLQKKLDRDGQLPPGLQKRLEPLPTDLERRLPRLPEQWERVILDGDVILIDRRTKRILDIIENVIGLASGR